MSCPFQVCLKDFFKNHPIPSKKMVNPWSWEYYLCEIARPALILWRAISSVLMHKVERCWKLKTCYIQVTFAIGLFLWPALSCHKLESTPLPLPLPPPKKNALRNIKEILNFFKTLLTWLYFISYQIKYTHVYTRNMAV